jgi:uncharacterized protein (DUF1684 family)
MARLEDLKAGTVVKGILPNGNVTVIDAKWIGNVAIELTYKDDSGNVNSELIYRDKEPMLEIVQAGLPWSFTADGEMLRLASEAYRIKLAHLFDPSSLNLTIARKLTYSSIICFSFSILPH